MAYLLLAVQVRVIYRLLSYGPFVLVFSAATAAQYRREVERFFVCGM